MYSDLSFINIRTESPASRIINARFFSSHRNSIYPQFLNRRVDCGTEVARPLSVTEILFLNASSADHANVAFY